MNLLLGKITQAILLTASDPLEVRGFLISASAVSPAAMVVPTASVLAPEGDDGATALFSIVAEAAILCLFNEANMGDTTIADNYTVNKLDDLGGDRFGAQQSPRIYVIGILFIRTVHSPQR